MSSTVATDKFRLPLNVKPSHYDLTILTDLNSLKFEGFVKIKLVKRRSQQILF